MLFPVRALSVSTLPSVGITRPLQSSYCYMPFPLHAHSIRLALPAESITRPFLYPRFTRSLLIVFCVKHQDRTIDCVL